MFEENTQSGSAQQGVVTPAASPAQTPAPAPQAPSVPAEPVDMFKDTERGQALPPTSPSDQPYVFQEEPEEKPWFLQKKFMFIILGAILLLIVIIFGVQFALSFFRGQPPASQKPAAVPEATQQAPTQEVQPTQETEPPVQQGQPLVPTEALGVQENNNAEQGTASPAPDTDGDGLTDAEETALGTDAAATDTDNDTLTDREEVKVFFTDPRNPDSDGDGYLDGLEVKSGFNPSGAGKLTIPAE
ncbi:hypothetical protein HY732_01400 [Candidatus Uhrbacteria bacterium]|nr:hypothetical protein [Candidatus Uhrbacteria bacterium]